jgi:hypothetical protein
MPSLKPSTKEPTMRSNKNEDLIQNAKALCTQLQVMQDLLLDMFFDEMLELDEEEDKLRLQNRSVPF